MGMRARQLVLVVLAVTASGCLTQSNLPAGVTASNVRKIQLGMSRTDVEGLLGPPLSVEPYSPGETNSESLIYFRGLPPPIHYPMLWVHLRDGKVFSVYAKRHDILNSWGVYVLSSSLKWESPEFVTAFPLGR